jgi:hypothetical protein
MMNIGEMTKRINDEMEKGIKSQNLNTDRDIILFKMAFLQGLTTGLKIDMED